MYIVSVLVITYNHEKYVAQAIESILMQKTNFNFEIVIGEDCSTDGTMAICIKYQKKYPDKIKLLLSDKNIGSIPNFINTLRACSGKYIALCEGDDYWTDPYKLQKQVDFLEANPEYSLCFHNTIITDEKYPGIKKLFNSPNQKIASTIYDVINGWFVASASMVFRRDFMQLPDWFKDIYNGDYALQLILADKGPFGYLNEVMGVYRKQFGGLSHNPKITPAYQNRKIIEVLNYFNDYTNKIYAININQKIKRLNQAIDLYLLRKRYPILKYMNYNSIKEIIRRVFQSSSKNKF